MAQAFNLTRQDPLLQGMHRRRNDRIYLIIPIGVKVTGLGGLSFVEQARTVTLSRHGATIALKRAISHPDKITICHLGSGKEAECRLVEESGGQADIHLYGIAFLDPAINLWGIDFPSQWNPENAAARVLLECESCPSIEVVYLDDLEAEVFAASRSICRACLNCRRTTVWKDRLRAMAGPIIPVLGHRTANDRWRPRIQTRLSVCLRKPGLADEFVFTENLSRGGLSFKSPTHYGAGSIVHSAVAYSPNAGNIFIPARIIYAPHLSSEGVNQHGLSYIQAA